MSKQLKALMCGALQEKYAGVEEACVVNITPLSVADTMKFRRALIGKRMRATVVKNSLARRAFEGGPLAPLGRSLKGPCALVTGGDSVIEVARELVTLAKTFTKVELKFGLLSGDSTPMPVAEVARLKGRMELRSDLAGLIGSPGRRVAGCLRSSGGKIAGCLQAILEKAGSDPGNMTIEAVT